VRTEKARKALRLLGSFGTDLLSEADMATVVAGIIPEADRARTGEVYALVMAAFAAGIDGPDREAEAWGLVDAALDELFGYTRRDVAPTVLSLTTRNPEGSYAIHPPADALRDTQVGQLRPVPSSNGRPVRRIRPSPFRKIPNRK